MKGGVLIIVDINTYSLIWNSHCRQSMNAGSLEKIIKNYDFIVNNNTDFSTCSSSSGNSIIDLALISSELSFLWVWEITKK